MIDSQPRTPLLPCVPGVNTSGYLDLLLIHFPFTIKPECYGLAGLSPICEVPYADAGDAARIDT